MDFCLSCNLDLDLYLSASKPSKDACNRWKTVKSAYFTYVLKTINSVPPFPFQFLPHNTLVTYLDSAFGRIICLCWIFEFTSAVIESILGPQVTFVWLSVLVELWQAEANTEHCLAYELFTSGSAEWRPQNLIFIPLSNWCGFSFNNLRLKLKWNCFIPAPERTHMTAGYSTAENYRVVNPSANDSIEEY